MYSFEQDKFVITEYNQSQPFSSFLPGISGLDGIPMWVFYVNRGQAIASFGVENKDSAIMEFYPANKSYQFTPTNGFRTFLKVGDGHGSDYCEPFSLDRLEEDVQESMEIIANQVELSYLNRTKGLEVKVHYFTLPHEDFAALVRTVTITNVAETEIKLEALDGLAAILPYGIPNAAYKELGNTLKAWMGVSNLENSVPFYQVRGSIADTAEVEQIHGGHFYLSYALGEGKPKLLTPIVDGDVVFGQNTSLSKPDSFLKHPLSHLQQQPVVTTNKVPCGFTGLAAAIQPGKSIQIRTMVGHTRDIANINSRIEELTDPQYLTAKANQARQLTQELTEPVATKTSNPLFDRYCRQSYLDNVLRGGHPVVFPNKDRDVVYHVYSRKHGDLERDYNFFTLAPTYYSQGNGNFRDVNQNRRSDVWFNPAVKDFNLEMFTSFIQADGYNPLLVKGVTFTIPDNRLPDILQFVKGPDQDPLRDFFEKSFTPGELLHFLEDQKLSLSCGVEEFLKATMEQVTQHYVAEPGEGFWVDHFTYNMDLLNSFLAIYPDKQEELLFGEAKYLFYDNPHVVMPRSEKYVLVNGKVRQYGAVQLDKRKAELIASRSHSPTWVRTDKGNGEIYKTNLYSKLVVLALCKFATSDPLGMGIEMEANKPGWNDSLNGLPGLFGSSMPEAFELKRIIQFLLAVETKQQIKLPTEVLGLLTALEQALKDYDGSLDPNKDHHYWDQVATARECYREQIKYGFSGSEEALAVSNIQNILKSCLTKLEQGIARAKEFGNGLYPTYFYYTPTEYQVIQDNQRNQQGLVNVRIERFSPNVVPDYLEGPTRAMKVGDRQEAVGIYHGIRQSSIYDQKLKMYKVGSSLTNQPFELGRATSFTPGWLEHESVFTHMEYKFMLELLRAGLYEEFYANLANVLVPFLDPQTYGRSTLEHSSFIASSANPDPAVHGRGFVARLSGATAEFLHMWTMMFAGLQPFRMHQGELVLALKPALPGWLFDEEDQVKFKFLGCCDVTYHNPKRANCFGEGGVKVQNYLLTTTDGEQIQVGIPQLTTEYAHMVRKGEIREIKGNLG